MPAVETHVDVYELCNETLRESFIGFGPLSPAALPSKLSHWNAAVHRIKNRLVEHSVPRRDAALFLRWYAVTSARMGWKVMCAQDTRR